MKNTYTEWKYFNGDVSIEYTSYIKNLRTMKSKSKSYTEIKEKYMAH
jgi:hypothetical protein